MFGSSGGSGRGGIAMVAMAADMGFVGIESSPVQRAVMGFADGFIDTISLGSAPSAARDGSQPTRSWGLFRWILTGDGYASDEVYRAGVSGFGQGAVDGLAMWANAATFHQINSLDAYVDRVIAENGTAYEVANVFMHISAYAAELAVAVGAWGALGGPQAGVAVNAKRHFMAGVGRHGMLRWMHSAGQPGARWVVGAGRTFGYELPKNFWGVTGIPIFSRAAAMGVLDTAASGSCFFVVVRVLIRGWFPVFF